MEIKKIKNGVWKRILVIAVAILILSLVIIPTPDSVLSESTEKTIELGKGWNYVGIPKEISASDLALKSTHITNIVRMSSLGYYVSYIPTIGAYDFICEPNEGIFIYSDSETAITFIIDSFMEDFSGDLVIKGNTKINDNLTVNGTMSVLGDLVINSLNVSKRLSVDGNLTVDQFLTVNEDLDIRGNLMVGKDLTIGNVLITEELMVNNDIFVAGDVVIEGNSRVKGDMIIDGDLSVKGDTNIDGDTVILGNLTASNFTVYDLTITDDLAISGNLSVGKDVTIGGDSTVDGDMVVKGKLTAGDFTVNNLTISEDLAINGNLTVDGNSNIGGDSTVEGDMVVKGKLTAGDFTVNNLTISEDLAINGNITVDGNSNIGGDSTVEGDMVVLGKLTAGDIDVNNLTVSEDLAINGNITVDGNSNIGGDSTVQGDMIVMGKLTAGDFTVINLTISDDLNINGNLSVKGDANIDGDLVVSGNITGITFADTSDYIIFKDESSVYYAKNGSTGALDYISMDASVVIQAAIDNLISRADEEIKIGGKIFIKSGTYWLSNPLSIEYRGDPNGTISIEGEGYVRTTTLKLVSASIQNSFLSLKGSRFLQFRNLHFDVNKKANYGIRMERESSGAGAGDHVFENIFVTNSVQVGILIYGSENNHLVNVQARYGNPIGMMITSVPPVADPTIKYSVPVNYAGQHYSNGGTVMTYCKWGEPSTTTRAGLIIVRSQVAAFGGLSMIRHDAEANFIIDETQNQCIFDGIWIDYAPETAFKIGKYPSGAKYDSYVTISGLTVRQMNGTDIIDADYISASTFTSISTSRPDGVITLGTNTQRNFISGFTEFTTGVFLTIIDLGTDNIIHQRNFINRGVATSISDGEWVSHGLASTPTIVILTPRSNVVVWVMARNNNQFQVGVSSGTVTIDWYAEV